MSEIANRYCKKCLLPEDKPNIWLNEEEICNICTDFAKKKITQGGNNHLESEFVKIIKPYKGKGKYDCLVMCSGGKDSIFSLYCMKKRYNFSPLVFTFDHGFESKEAVRNIKNAVNALNVDWLYYKTNFMKDIFALMINSQTKAPICHVCAIWYMQFTYEMAKRYKIPLIVAGWTRGQCVEQEEKAIEYLSMSNATTDFIKNILYKYPKYKKFPRSMYEAIKSAQRSFRCRVVSPHWYLQWDSDRKMKILKGELNWNAPSLSYPAGSTNCLMNFVSVYLTMKNYGYTHYHIEESKLIRRGEVTKEDALKRLAVNFDRNFLNNICQKVGCNLES